MTNPAIKRKAPKLQLRGPRHKILQRDFTILTAPTPNTVSYRINGQAWLRGQHGSI